MANIEPSNLNPEDILGPHRHARHPGIIICKTKDIFAAAVREPAIQAALHPLPIKNLLRVRPTLNDMWQRAEHPHRLAISTAFEFRDNGEIAMGANDSVTAFLTEANWRTLTGFALSYHQATGYPDIALHLSPVIDNESIAGRNTPLMVASFFQPAFACAPSAGESLKLETGMIGFSRTGHLQSVEPEILHQDTPVLSIMVEPR